ncbi:MAG: phoA 5, partial [Bacteroidetes bacterium]|nr:phoA 5 [Bacteroidota bacterium]
PLIAGHVDLALSGHDHFYQRIAPQEGTYFFVSGGGSNLRTGGDFRHPLVQKGAKINHFMDLEATPGEVHFRVVDAEGRIFDQGVLTRLRK